jgi:hypothetical protein
MLTGGDKMRFKVTIEDNIDWNVAYSIEIFRCDSIVTFQRYPVVGSGRQIIMIRDSLLLARTGIYPGPITVNPPEINDNTRIKIVTNAFTDEWETRKEMSFITEPNPGVRQSLPATKKEDPANHGF